MALLVAWDMENTMSHIRRDQQLPEDRYTLSGLHAAIAEIEETAHKISGGAVARRIAAFSIPSPFGQTRSTTPQIMLVMKDFETLEQHGYMPLLTTHGPNRADHILTEVVLRFLWGDSTSCLLITDDGRHPFPRFAHDAHARNKTMHFAGYKAIPPSLRGFPDATYTVLAGGIAQKLEAPAPLIPKIATTHVPSPPTPLVESARKFARNPLDDSIEPRHKLTLQQMVAAIAAAIAEEGRTKWGLAELTRAIEYHWTGRPPREEEVRTMLQVLVRSGKLFQEWQTFEYSPDPKFLQEIHE